MPRDPLDPTLGDPRGNIDLLAQPVVRNPDGSTSTVDSFSVNIDGNEVLLPTVTPDGRHLTQDEAIKEFQRTGRHLGMFPDVPSANWYGEQLHDVYARDALRQPDFRTTAIVPPFDPEGVRAPSGPPSSPGPGSRVLTPFDAWLSSVSAQKQAVQQGLLDRLPAPGTSLSDWLGDQAQYAWRFGVVPWAQRAAAGARNVGAKVRAVSGAVVPDVLKPQLAEAWETFNAGDPTQRALRADLQQLLAQSFPDLPTVIESETYPDIATTVQAALNAPRQAARAVGHAVVDVGTRPRAAAELMATEAGAPLVERAVARAVPAAARWLRGGTEMVGPEVSARRSLYDIYREAEEAGTGASEMRGHGIRPIPANIAVGKEMEWRLPGGLSKEVLTPEELADWQRRIREYGETGGIHGYHGTPFDWPAERLLPTGEFRVGTPGHGPGVAGTLPSLEEGAESILDFPYGRPRQEMFGGGTGGGLGTASHGAGHGVTRDPTTAEMWRTRLAGGKGSKGVPVYVGNREISLRLTLPPDLSKATAAQRESDLARRLNTVAAQRKHERVQDLAATVAATDTQLAADAAAVPLADQSQRTFLDTQRQLLKTLHESGDLAMARRGSVSEQRILAHLREFLDWHQPYSQQSPQVRRALYNLLGPARLEGDPLGWEMYRMIDPRSALGASQKLRRAGVVGEMHVDPTTSWTRLPEEVRDPLIVEERRIRALPESAEKARQQQRLLERRVAAKRQLPYQPNFTVFGGVPVLTSRKYQWLLPMLGGTGAASQIPLPAPTIPQQ